MRSLPGFLSPGSKASRLPSGVRLARALRGAATDRARNRVSGNQRMRDFAHSAGHTSARSRLVQVPAPAGIPLACSGARGETMMRPVNTALVLAAGNGDRFRNPTRESKLLQPVLGRPLIIRTIETAHDAGITAFEIVLGYQADRVRAAIERQAPPDVAIHFTHNPDWHLENGVSVLAARGRLRSRFALLMGDHLFEARVLRQLRLAPAGAG